MPYFKDSTEWYEQSSLLLKARPSTARVTSKYTVLKPTSSKISKRQKYASKRAATSDTTTSAPNTEPTPPTAQESQEAVQASTATFTLKTYDPVSGVCLQYETNKAAEVGRLISTLGRLGKHMAAIKEVTDDLADPASRGGIDTPDVVVEEAKGDVEMTDVGKILESKTGGGGGKKKKKGKK